MNKTWVVVLYGVLFGLLSSAVIILVSHPPKGHGIHLDPQSTAGPIQVAVIGQVAEPGVYSLAPGSRVYEVIKAAGGFLQDADQQSVNQAAVLEDGQQVYVAKIGECTPTPQSTQVESHNTKSTPAFSKDNPLNLNTATLDELVLLPGIGEEKAQNILNYRDEHGSFQTIEEIMDVPGIGEATFEDLKEMITTGNP